MNRQARRASTRHTALGSTTPDPTKDRATTIATAIVFFVLFAFLMIPVVWALVRGYRWALG